MMGRRKFKSFDEVDRELQILNLRREIAAESLKGRVLSVRKALSPDALAHKLTRKAAFAALSFFLRKRL